MYVTVQSIKEDNAKKAGMGKFTKFQENSNDKYGNGMDSATVDVPCDGKEKDVKMLNDKALDKKAKKEKDKREREIKKQKEKELKNSKKLKSEKNIKILPKTKDPNPPLVPAKCPEPVQVICPESQSEIVPVEKKSWSKCCLKKSKESKSPKATKTKSKEQLALEERTVSKTSIKIEIAVPSTECLVENKPSETSQRSSKSPKISKCAKSSRSANTLIIHEEKFSQCEIFEFFPMQKPPASEIARGRGCATDCSKTQKRDSSFYETINNRCQRPKAKLEICKPYKPPQEKKPKKEKKPSFSDEFTEKLKQGYRKIQKNALPFLKKKSRRTVKRMKGICKNVNGSRSKSEVNCYLRDCATEMSICVSNEKQDSTSSLESKNNCLKKSKTPNGSMKSSSSNKSLQLIEPYSAKKDNNESPKKNQNLRSCKEKQSKKSNNTLKSTNTDSKSSIKSESSKELNLKKRRKRSSCCSKNNSPNDSKEDISYRPFNICECPGNPSPSIDFHDLYSMCCCPDGMCENVNENPSKKSKKSKNQEKSKNHK